MKIRSVIIENEIQAQRLLSSILKEYVPSIDLVGITGNIKDAKLLIEEQKPDLVFLDIELDDGNAFDLLEKINNRNFKLIFITAYDKFALKAFEYEAVDYIVKPYSPKEIKKSVERIEQIPFFGAFRDELLALLAKDKYQNAKLTLSNSDGIEIIRIADIIRLEGERSYCTFFLQNGYKILISKPLKEYELILPSNHFFRVHQSHLINLEYIMKVSNEDGGLVIMKNLDQVPIAKRRKKDFLKIFGT